MLKLTHFRISRFSPTKIGTNITLELLSEDLPRDTRDELENLWKSGNSLVGIIQGIDEEVVKEEGIGALVSKLHYLMQKYCEKEGINFEVYNREMKTRYKITHKNEMSRQDLEREIERHKAGLM